MHARSVAVRSTHPDGGAGATGGRRVTNRRRWCLNKCGMSTIEEIKARLDIVDVVSGYVPELKQRGQTWKARCPFHQERTPSFTVDPGRGTWHCFGSCSTGGDVLSFIQKIERLEFREALRLAADRAGVELGAPSPRQRELQEAQERLLAANEAACTYYRSQLDGPAGAAALRYAEDRGLDTATRQRWEIGYAPPGWNGLVDYLRARGFGDGELVDAGLAIAGDRGAYDRFRDRLIYPTRDHRRRLVGFGARALRPDQEPKYLNTPQTPLFDKSGTLYGLDHAGEPARRADRVVVVEGYMDVIACHRAGFEEAIASMGTSITEKQMRLIQRFTSNVVLALDADAAGSEAALRGVAVAAGAAQREAAPTIDWRGLVTYEDRLRADIRVCALPDGEDPDSLVRADPERFGALLAAALPVADHLFGAVEAQTDVEDPRARSRAVDALAPTVAAIADPVVRSHYLQRLGRLARLDERALAALVRERSQPPAAAPGDGAAPRGPQPVASSAEITRAQRRGGSAPAPDGEAQLLQLLLVRDAAVRSAGIALDAALFEDAVHRALFETWRQGPLLESDLDGFDEPLRERAQVLLGDVPEALNGTLLGDEHAAEQVADIARRLRNRRQAGRTAQMIETYARERETERHAGEIDRDAQDEYEQHLARARALRREHRVFARELPPEAAVAGARGADDETHGPAASPTGAPRTEQSREE